MKYKRRRFVPGECMHIYQRSVEGFNIFYGIEDYLVFFMIFSVVARLYKVTILELCIMINHIHVLLASEKLKEVSDFIMHYTSLFAREFNRDSGRRGPLFHKSFGSAPKTGSKSIRSTIVYIGNNPVEKGICASADGYKWNFLSYMRRMKSGVRIPERELSRRLLKYMKVVDGMNSRDQYISYNGLRKMMADLNAAEVDMLADHIIMTYWPFDSDYLLEFYGSYENMIMAMRSTSGNEYDIKELYYPESDSVYKKMITLMRNELKVESDHQVKVVLTMTPEEKFRLAQILQRHTCATLNQISRFLHLPIKSSTSRDT